MLERRKKSARIGSNPTVYCSVFAGRVFIRFCGFLNALKRLQGSGRNTRK
jgi:hypothetical protein